MTEVTGSTRRRRLLFIVYEFPPSAGGGVQRVTKFARYLTEEGWDVRVLSAELLPGRPQDPTLLSEVRGVPVVRLKARHVATAIARMLAPFKGLRSSAKPAGSTDSMSETGTGKPAARPLSSRLARWIAMPDDAVLWSRSVPAHARRLHQEEPFDAVLASGPPYSALVAGVRTGESLGIPAVSDLRDLWANSFRSDWPRAAQARRYLALEREVMTKSTAVVTASEVMEAEAREMGASRTMVLTNGFDAEDMPVWSPSPEGPLRLAFLGRLSPGATDPTLLFKALARARGRYGPMGECRLDIVGPDAPWAQELARQLGIDDAVRFLGFKPYREALDLVAVADWGVSVFESGPGSVGHYPGKLFDYLGIGIPLLVVGSEDSGAAAVARETGCGVVIATGDVDEAADILISLARAKRSGAAPCVPDPAVSARYERRAQVHRLSALLSEVVGG